MGFMRMRSRLICLLLVSLSAPAFGEESSSATSARAVAGDEIGLADKSILHLEGIAQPLAGNHRREQAQKQLQELITGRPIVFENAVTDRYGRMTAQV
jgi:endonuclease YncB( thermonuclease family)